ncbi:hypothetical protein AB1K54_04960 [Microbacterium sp. BWT-B31]|uniref:hypothetical protein n=1 Tax=Microbacterium sp. BWT-B31 TaxID=3232072 RepID=UPI003527CFD3
MNARQQRALRGVAASFVATVVAATAHTLGGGGAGSPVLLAAVALLAAPPAVALVGRRLSTPRLALVVVASQALFHVAFALTCAADPSRATGGHQHVPALAPVSGSGPAALLPDSPMLAAHALAAALTLAVLAKGERMLRTIARGIRSLVTTRVAALPAAPAALPRLASAPAGPAPRPVLAPGSPLRGPPLFSHAY